MDTKKPQLVALCGHPGSGKSAVQHILNTKFGFLPFDDAAIGRRHCREIFGLSERDVHSGTGKEDITVIQGARWKNRQIIGEYLSALEEKFGDMIVPDWAIRSALANWPVDVSHRPDLRGYSFGSVRMGQSLAYSNAGGIVIEIVNPRVERNENIWDDYDKDLVDYTYVNDKLDLPSLREDFVSFFKSTANGMNPISEAA